MLYAVCSNTDNLYTIDLTTGNATLVGSTGAGNLLGLTFATPVPEPGLTVVAVALGGAVLLGGRSRRRSGG